MLSLCGLATPLLRTGQPSRGSVGRQKRLSGVHHLSIFPLPPQAVSFGSRCQRKASSIIQDHNHPGHQLLVLVCVCVCGPLWSAHRSRCIPSRFKNSFYPQATPTELLITQLLDYCWSYNYTRLTLLDYWIYTNLYSKVIKNDRHSRHGKLTTTTKISLSTGNSIPLSAFCSSRTRNTRHSYRTRNTRPRCSYRTRNNGPRRF